MIVTNANPSTLAEILPPHPDDPVKKLMAAILEDAIRCFVNYRTATRVRTVGLYREAEEWLFSASAEDGFTFSFEAVCDVLHIEPEFLRGGIRSYLASIEAGGRKIGQLRGGARMHVPLRTATRRRKYRSRRRHRASGVSRTI